MPLEHARSLYEHARALFDKAHRGDAIAACRELVEGYGAADDPAERTVATRALRLQAQAFSSPWVARREEALALFDEVLRRIDEAGAWTRTARSPQTRCSAWPAPAAPGSLRRRHRGV